MSCCRADVLTYSIDPHAAFLFFISEGLFYATNASNFTIRGPGAVNGAAAAWNTHDNPPVPDGLVRSNMFVRVLTCSECLALYTF